MDILIQIVNAALLGDKSYPISDKCLLNNVLKELKSNKADYMRRLCEAIIDEKIKLEIPKHIGEIISCVRDY
jgi:hypothetical protein